MIPKGCSPLSRPSTMPCWVFLPVPFCERWPNRQSENHLSAGRGRGVSRCWAGFGISYSPSIRTSGPAPSCCVTGGLSLLLLAVFYWIIDVKGIKGWTFFFTDHRHELHPDLSGGRIHRLRVRCPVLLRWFAQAVFLRWSRRVGGVLAFLAVKWVFLYFLYKKKMFLRV